MMRVRIMAHPSRRDAALWLSHRIAALAPEIVWDPDPAGPPRPLRTLLRVCTTIHDDSPLLVLQEDAVPCVGFERAAVAAVAAAPSSVVALYAGQLLRAVPLLRAAAARGATLVELGTREYVPTVAVALPPGAARSFVEWAPRNLPPTWRHDDEALGAWARGASVEVVTTIPCLANHDNALPSVAGHGHHGPRTAWCWPGEHDMSRVRWER